MPNTANRLFVVAGLVVVTFLVAHFVTAGLKTPGVQMPDWTFSDMPLQLGDWRGQPTEIDPKIAVATGASVIVNRDYQDRSGQHILMHTAMFSDPADGVFHTPIICYLAGGWQKQAETREELEVSDKLTTPVSLTTWEGDKQQRILVVYWYQLGEHVLFDRWDLGMKVRWSLRGRPKWPALIKVMLQIAAPDPDEARSIILDFATQVAAWENQPKHRAQMLGESVSPASEKSGGEK
jgi:EpsI family protein